MIGFIAPFASFASVALMASLSSALAEPGPGPAGTPVSYEGEAKPTGPVWLSRASASPRYTSLPEVPAQRTKDIEALTAALATMDEQQRLRARRLIDDRISALDRMASEDKSGSLVDADRHLLLLAERDTLRHQISLLDGNPATAARDRRRGDADRVSVGQDVVIGPDEVVRDVVVVGADLIVRGHVTHDAVVVMGAMQVEPTGHVDGDAVCIGGQLDVDQGGVVNQEHISLDLDPLPAAQEAVRAATSPWALALGRTAAFSAVYGLLLVLGVLAPGASSRTREALEVQPLRSFAYGLLVTPGMVVAAIGATATIVGIPFALLLVTLLAWAWLLGLHALSDAVSARMPFTGAPLVTMAVFVGALVGQRWLPWPAWAALIAGQVWWTGAALVARFGAQRASA